MNLFLYGTRKHHKVHRLVGKAFIPNPYNKPEINHINGIKTDNNIKNLEWCTSEENNEHAVISLGREYQRRRSVIQLTPDNTVVKIYPSICSILKEYSTFKHGRITRVCNGERKTYKGFKWMYSEDFNN